MDSARMRVLSWLFACCALCWASGSRAAELQFVNLEESLDLDALMATDSSGNVYAVKNSSTGTYSLVHAVETKGIWATDTWGDTQISTTSGVAISFIKTPDNTLFAVIGGGMQSYVDIYEVLRDARMVYPVNAAPLPENTAFHTAEFDGSGSLHVLGTNSNLVPGSNSHQLVYVNNVEGRDNGTWSEPVVLNPSVAPKVITYEPPYWLGHDLHIIDTSSNGITFFARSEAYGDNIERVPAVTLWNAR